MSNYCDYLESLILSNSESSILNLLVVLEKLEVFSLLEYPDTSDLVK